MAKKKCTKCGVEKPRDAFDKNRNKPDGRQAWCKLCRQSHVKSPRRRAYKRTYDKANRAKHKKTNRTYYQANRKRILLKRQDQSYKIRDRDSELRRLYGISLAEYAERYEEQQGRCKICKQPETATFRGQVLNLAVDHDHGTGKVRGLLCVKCNHLLGAAMDSTTILARAILYLRASQSSPVSSSSNTSPPNSVALGAGAPVCVTGTGRA